MIPTAIFLSLRFLLIIKIPLVIFQIRISGHCLFQRIQKKFPVYCSIIVLQIRRHDDGCCVGTILNQLHLVSNAIFLFPSGEDCRNLSQDVFLLLTYFSVLYIINPNIFIYILILCLIERIIQNPFRQHHHDAYAGGQGPHHGPQSPVSFLFFFCSRKSQTVD